MKKLLFLSALVLLGSREVWAQGGTVEFQNTFTSAFYTNNPSGPPGRVSTAPGTMNYGLFYSDATTGGLPNNLLFATSVGNSTLGYGVIDGNTSVALPGTNPGDQAWIMVLAWDGALGPNGYTHYIGPYGSGPAGGPSSQWDGAGQWFLQTRTIPVTLGAYPYPGTVMLQTPGDASHLGGTADLTIFAVPEPSALVLIVSGTVAIVLSLQRKRGARIV